MKALVLFSGGVDSTTCLAEVIGKYGKDEVLALSVSYGQKHSKELEVSKRIADHYGVRYKRLDLAQIFADSDCSLLQGSESDIPKESYAEQLKKTDGKPVSTYVPFRNGLFLASAASIANDAINSAIYIGSGKQLRVIAPFVELNKADVVARGLELNVPYELTWSCYEGGDKPCGKCGTCLDRAAAFRANGINDPALEV